MATCTFAVGTADTGAPPNTSGAFTPASGDLLVVFCSAPASVDASPTLTSSIGGFTFSLIRHQTNTGATNSQYVFVSDSLVSSATSQTVTFDTPNDGANGSIIAVYRVSGMSRTGTSAVRQSTGAAAASGSPAITFSSSCLTGNPTLGAVTNLSNPATITPNASWTEPAGGDIGHINPTFGMAVCHRDSGFTGTGVTWGGASGTAHFEQMIELDTSSASQTGSGAATLPLLTASGAGKKTRKSTGTPSLPLLTASGSGKKTRKAVGALTLPLLTASGSGKKTRKGSGAPTLPLLTASGVGESTPAVPTHDSDGAATLPLITASGAGKKTRKATGALTLPLLTASGSSKKTRKATGAPSLPLLTASGDVKKTRLSVGAASLPLLTASGDSKKTRKATGALTLPALTADGEGDGGTMAPEVVRAGRMWRSFMSDTFA